MQILVVQMNFREFDYPFIYYHFTARSYLYGITLEQNYMHNTPVLCYKAVSSLPVQRFWFTILSFLLPLQILQKLTLSYGNSETSARDLFSQCLSQTNDVRGRRKSVNRAEKIRKRVARQQYIIYHFFSNSQLITANF